METYHELARKGAYCVGCGRPAQWRDVVQVLRRSIGDWVHVHPREECRKKFSSQEIVDSFFVEWRGESGWGQ